MAAITQQQLNNAAADAQALEDIVNGAADRPNAGQAAGTVTTRLGRVIRTLANVIGAITFQETIAVNAAAAAKASAGTVVRKAQTTELLAYLPTPTIGRKNVAPAASTYAAQFTTMLVRPTINNSQLREMRVRLSAGATNMVLKVFRLTNNVPTQVGADVPFVCTANALNVFSLADGNMPTVLLNKGDYLGWYVTGGNVAYTPADNTNPEQDFIRFGGGGQTAGNVNTINSPSAGGTSAAIGFDFDSTDAPIKRSTIDATQELLDTAINLVAAATPIGARMTLANPGASVSDLTIIFNRAAVRSGNITRLSLFASKARTFKFRTGQVISNSFVPTGAMQTVNMAVGLNVYDISVPISKGEYIGWYAADAIASPPGTGDTIFYGGGDLLSLGSTGDLFAFAGSVPQVTFEYSYPALSAGGGGITQLSQADYDALAAPDAGKQYVAKSAKRQRLYAGALLIASLFIPNIAAVGDSTVAAYAGGDAVDSFLKGATTTTLAVPGHTIDQQRAVWNAQSAAAKAAYDIVVVQIGLNDVANVGSQAAADAAVTATLVRYRALLADIRASVSATCKIIVSKMLPCLQRWLDIFGATNGPFGQSQWAQINDAVAGIGSNPLTTNVDGRVIAHVPLLDDGTGRLAAAYNTGDGIHENNAGRKIIANAWRDVLTMLGLLG